MIYRLLDIAWDVADQYEMLKISWIEWYWLLQYKIRERPVRKDLKDLVRYVLRYEPSRYDAAILHVDRECLDPAAWTCGRGAIYEEMNDLISDIPKIVMLHGTPGQVKYPSRYSAPGRILDRVRDIAGDKCVVVESRQAAQEWGCGVPVTHHLDPAEWFDLPKQPRVLIPRIRGRYSSERDLTFASLVNEELRSRDIVCCWIGETYSPVDWNDYRQILGRSLIYLDLAEDSSSPRARAEAMFSGCCLLCFPTHDAATLLSNGINGFVIGRQVSTIGSLVDELLCDPDRKSVV